MSLVIPDSYACKVVTLVNPEPELLGDSRAKLLGTSVHNIAIIPVLHVGHSFKDVIYNKNYYEKLVYVEFIITKHQIDRA